MIDILTTLAKIRSLLFFIRALFAEVCHSNLESLYGDAMFVSFWGAQIWRPQSNRNICHWVLLLKHKIIALELRHIERNVSSRASTVQLAKANLLTYTTAFSGRNFHVTQRKKLGNSNMLYYNKKNPIKLKHCETSSSFRVFYLIKLKPQKEK